MQVGINVEIVAEEAALAQTDMLDPAKWDLLISQIGGGSQVGEWNRPMNNKEFGTEYNMAFIADDTLQEKLLNVMSLAGHTDENTTDIRQQQMQFTAKTLQNLYIVKVNSCVQVHVTIT